MKAFTNRLIVLGVMVLVAGLLQTSFAQGQGRGQGMRMSPKERAEALGKQLSLDTVTVAKIAVIMDKSQKMMADKREELQGDMDGMRAAMTAIRDSSNKWITAILTPEQAKKYEEVLKEQQQRMQQRQRNN